MCNKLIKFGCFEQRVGKDFDVTATGHYATTVLRDGKTWLGTAADSVKDQTDFLAQIDYLQVSKLMFPLGRLMKNEVRDIALRAGLPSARRRDSQGICFLGKIDYNDFVRRFLGEREGDIVELETGRKLGKHRGYWFHTIGQRKGLGLGGGPWFVVRKDVEENVIYVSRGCDTALQYGYEFRMYDFHFITDNPWKGAQEEVEVTFKIRHTPEFVKGRLQKEAEGYRIVSEEKLQGIAPGQLGDVYKRQAFMAYLVASCALFTPSFRKIFFRWLFTVWKLRFRSAAISLVVFPRAISFRMLRSAVVSKSSLMVG